MYVRVVSFGVRDVLNLAGAAHLPSAGGKGEL